ncbi:phage integrase SAM-like domain-containing protein [Maribacter sp. ACAM166]|uniref:phage integrase SAM-like domain-containing protein n=1 Tax=Maribacter sp. ACAM166 TaxID=2508996 RepID=UPI00397738A8
MTKEKKTTIIFLKKLNHKYIYDFKSYLANYWLKDDPRGISQNTIMKHIKRLSKIVTLAYHME